jgi:chaperonin cofactor prefoldin
MTMIVSHEEFTTFNKAIAKGAMAAQKLNPIKVKPRHSSFIRAELDRIRLSLNSVGTLLTRSEETLAKATAALAEANDRLAELRKAGYAENSAPVQKLLGSSFRSKATDLPVHQDGVIDRLNRAIEEHTPRVKALEGSHKRENARIAPIVRKLEAELAEALRLERISEAR